MKSNLIMSTNLLLVLVLTYAYLNTIPGVNSIGIGGDRSVENATAIPKNKLTQAEVSQVKTIELDDYCDGIANFEVSRAKFNLPFYGSKYNFTVPPPKLNELRMAFAGDSITFGCCGTNQSVLLQLSDKYRTTDNDHGVQHGFVNSFEGLAWHLLKNKNSSMNYTFLNYGSEAAQIIDDPNPIYKWPQALTDMGFKERNPVWYPKSCRADQLSRSLPHVVFMAFGGCDELLPSFDEDKFVRQYSEYIQSVKSLPSKPIIMLMVPTFNRLTYKQGEQCITDKNDPFFPGHTTCPIDSRIDLQYIIYNRIAKQNDIPEYHILNAWQLLRLNPKVAANEVFIEDGAHPNERGMSILAQELYTRMSKSPEIQHRQEMLQEGMDKDWNNAVRTLVAEQQQKAAQIAQQQHNQILNK